MPSVIQAKTHLVATKTMTISHSHLLPGFTTKCIQTHASVLVTNLSPPHINKLCISNKKSELMLMRCTRAYSSSCSQVI